MMDCYKALGILCSLFAFSVSSVALAELTAEDFIGYWLLDDGKGDKTEDASGHRFDGTITGGKWDEGHIDGGLEFDGESTFIEVLHSDEFNLNQLTLAA